MAQRRMAKRPNYKLTKFFKMLVEYLFYYSKQMCVLFINKR